MIKYGKDTDIVKKAQDIIDNYVKLIYNNIILNSE